MIDVLYGNDSGRLTHISWSPATVYADEDNIKLQYVPLLIVLEPDPQLCHKYICLFISALRLIKWLMRNKKSNLFCLA